LTDNTVKQPTDDSEEVFLK